MNMSARIWLPCLLVLMASCATRGDKALTEHDINEPSPGACKVNIHVDPRGKFVYIDQEPVITSRCGNRTVRFQVNGGYRFTGKGIELKSGGSGALPDCKFKPANNNTKKVECEFAEAPADPSKPDFTPYLIKVEKNDGTGALTLDPVMIND